jgi:hypothetical protein
MLIETLAQTLRQVYTTLGQEWEGYGTPSVDDLRIAIAAMIDNLDGVEGNATIGIPAAGLEVVRDDGEYSVWIRAGRISIEELRNIDGDVVPGNGEAGTPVPGDSPGSDD